LAGKRILVVEDNPTTRWLVQHLAKRWGLEVRCAEDAGSALGGLRENPHFDALVVDLQLPDRDGLDLIKEISKIQGSPLPVVLPLSWVRLREGDPRLAGLDPAIQSALLSFSIQKPIRPGQFLQTLSRAILPLPFRRGEGRGEGSPYASTPPAASPAHPLRLLAADDNAINQKVIFSLLRKLGHQADMAKNGTEVLTALERQSYDILFLDVQMPELDGLETARRICQRWPAQARPRIIAMTGNALLGDREKCLEAGMDDYISKPVSVSELRAALERWSPQTRTPSAKGNSPP
jgi:CheY-like chemotaxis protein